MRRAQHGGRPRPRRTDVRLPPLPPHPARCWFVCSDVVQCVGATLLLSDTGWSGGGGGRGSVGRWNTTDVLEWFQKSFRWAGSHRPPDLHNPTAAPSLSVVLTLSAAWAQIDTRSRWCKRCETERTCDRVTSFVARVNGGAVWAQGIDGEALLALDENSLREDLKVGPLAAFSLARESLPNAHSADSEHFLTVSNATLAV